MNHKLTTKTIRVLNEERATSILNYLVENIEWEDGIRSKKGFTRKAKSVQVGSELYETLIPVLSKAVEKLKPLWVEEYEILGMYINFYENGEMYTPNHSHPGQHQFVLSLGCERPLIIGKKTYVLKNGEGVLFGSSQHGVPKGDYSTPRVSIALFMKPHEDEDNGIISLEEIQADPFLSALAVFFQDQNNLKAVYEMAKPV